MNLFTLSQVVEITQSDRRTVQFWVESGALLPSPETDRAGKGVHRLFCRDEVIVARAISAAAQSGASIGVLIAIAKEFRGCLSEAGARSALQAVISSGMPAGVIIRPGRPPKATLILDRSVLSKMVAANSRSASAAVLIFFRDLDA